MNEYRILAQNGKYGLFYNEQIVLDSLYSSIKIISEDTALQELVPADTWSKINDCWNPLVSNFENDFAVVSADGKEGLLFFGQIALKFKYERIIKLSFRHYLCQKGTTYTLYENYPVAWRRFRSLAKIKVPTQLTLEKVLCALAQTHPEIREDLSKYLYKAPQLGAYISEYHTWQGMVQRLLPCHSIDVYFATQRVFIDNDFQVTPLDVLVCY